MESSPEKDLPPAAGLAAPRVVAVLSSILERVAERNDAVAAAAPPGRRSPLSAFRGKTKPAISVRSYLRRIFEYAGCSSCCYVVAYVYIDRLLLRCPGLAVDSFNVHRLLITAVLAAAKFSDDICYNNAYYAKVGGISLPEMNYLEVDFLFRMGFDLNVSRDSFTSYCIALQSEMESIEAPPVERMRLHCLPSEENTNRSAQQLTA